MLLLGRLVEEKGFDVALRACVEVVGAVPGVRILVAGDGPARADLLALVDELGLADVVEWLGAVSIDDVPAVIARATVVVVPSRYEEPFGLVAVEAGLAGRPVVATRVGGLPEVVDDDGNGLLVPPEDPAALTAALLTVLGDRELAVRLGTAGRARAEHDFALDQHVDAFEALFERLVVGARRVDRPLPRNE